MRTPSVPTWESERLESERLSRGVLPADRAVAEDASACFTVEAGIAVGYSRVRATSIAVADVIGARFAVVAVVVGAAKADPVDALAEAKVTDRAVGCRGIFAEPEGIAKIFGTRIAEGRQPVDGTGREKVAPEEYWLAGAVEALARRAFTVPAVVDRIEYAFRPVA